MAGELEFMISLLTATMRLATPLLLASLGETICQRSGVLNLGLEGVMAVGAFSAFAVTFYTGNVWLGIGSAVLVGALIGLLHAFVSITIRVNQSISGIAIAILGVGLGGYFYRAIFGVETIPPQINPSVIHLNLPALTNLPIIGPIIFQQSFFFFFGIIMVPVLAIVISRTTIGLKIRAVGENPKAADTLGVKVFYVRYGSVIFGSIMAALGGAVLSLDVGTFREYMVAGRGWIAVALVAFARWNPYIALGGALLFGGTDALQLRLQTMNLGISPYIFWMLPYIITIIALVLVYRGAGAPASLGTPYKRDE
jgi:general nucleoside transport system permease protein